MTGKTRDLLMQSVLEMKAWPDAGPALRELKKRGLELVFLANPSAAMLDRWIENSGLEGVFGSHLSTDLVRAFKPDPRAYQLGVNVLRLERDEIVFAAFGGWDAAGAKAFGYPTFWVNRANAPEEGLGFEPDAVGTDLHSLVAFVAGSQIAEHQRTG
jgi:2-haloacid dehalogenase